jgi:rSAM/selenodomain-associated transferase 1
MNIIVIAKAPVPGRVKTRLCPPCTPIQAAALAEAALRDTLRATTRVRGARTVLALDGAIGSWLPDDVDVIPQRGGRLDERIAAAFEDAGTAALLIGMDTPQVTPVLLTSAIEVLSRDGVDAVLGHAADGGWWAAGVRRFVSDAFVGVPMSTAVTGCAQRARFESLGWRVGGLPTLRDVDTFEDALVIAEMAPSTRFAQAVTAFEPASAWLTEAGA